MDYTDEVSIYCYYQTSKSNKKILCKSIKTSMISMCTKNSINQKLCIMAAKCGYLNILKWSIKNHYPHHKNICNVAADNGAAHAARK